MILGRWRSGYRRFQETWCLCWRWRFLGRLDSWNRSKKYSKILWILKMDAFCSFETLGTNYPVTRVRLCENPKPCVTPACLWQGCKGCAPGRTSPTSPRGSLLSEYHTLSGTSINVNSFTPIRNVRCYVFTEFGWHVHWCLLCRISWKSRNKRGKYG